MSSSTTPISSEFADGRRGGPTSGIQSAPGGAVAVAVHGLRAGDGALRRVLSGTDGADRRLQLLDAEWLPGTARMDVRQLPGSVRHAGLCQHVRGHPVDDGRSDRADPRDRISVRLLAGAVRQPPLAATAPVSRHPPVLGELPPPRHRVDDHIWATKAPSPVCSACSGSARRPGCCTTGRRSSSCLPTSISRSRH